MRVAGQANAMGLQQTGGVVVPACLARQIVGFFCGAVAGINQPLQPTRHVAIGLFADAQQAPWQVGVLVMPGAGDRFTAQVLAVFIERDPRYGQQRAPCCVAQVDRHAGVGALDAHRGAGQVGQPGKVTPAAGVQARVAAVGHETLGVMLLTRNPRLRQGRRVWVAVVVDSPGHQAAVVHDRDGRGIAMDSVVRKGRHRVPPVLEFCMGLSGWRAPGSARHQGRAQAVSFSSCATVNQG